jgi:hypothetical protein
MTMDTSRSPSAYPLRICPCCGREAPANRAVRTAIDAAEQSFEDLIPQWNGFFKDKSIFAYARCGACGLLYAPRYFDGDQLARLYAQMPPNMDEVPLPALRATQQGYFAALRRHSPLTGGYLEVGPDVGLFTECCAREGRFSEYWLLEPNRSVEKQLASVIEGRRYHVVQEMPGFPQVPDGAISTAVMIHVLDHLLEPVATLKELRRTLAPGATVLIVTHDESSLLRHAIGNRWPPFCLQHPQIYNPKSIRQVLAAAGFDVIEARKTVNHFEIRFLVKHLLWALGLRTQRVPRLGNAVVGLKLGNMLTIARPKAETGREQP